MVLRVADLGPLAIEALLGKYGLDLEVQSPQDEITGSFWGDCEAGVAGHTVFVRADTPVHSVLHETCHIICMSADRRAELETDAGGDDLEEAAVCYLQLLLADELTGVGRDRLMTDMDAWGYSFRLGSTRSWFEEDADDARDWLTGHGLIGDTGLPLYRLRE